MFGVRGELVAVLMMASDENVELDARSLFSPIPKVLRHDDHPSQQSLLRQFRRYLLTLHLQESAISLLISQRQIIHFSFASAPKQTSERVERREKF
jgi:hypothetical protein